MILHADEFSPAVLLSDELHACELCCPHAACADVAHFSGLHEIVECFHGFFEGRVVVKAVNLEKVDVVGVETCEGCVDLVEDCGAGEAILVLVVF